MPPRSPLPPRHGLDPAWLRTPSRVRGEPEPWSTMGAWLRAVLPPEAEVELLLAERRFAYEDGGRLRADDPYRQHVFVWFHRVLRDEPEVPGELAVLHRDERIVVADKPPFMSTIPRGRHVRQSVVVLLRDLLGLPELTPAHRLDRVTSGLLVLTTERRWRGAYQSLFQQRAVRKVYRAIAPLVPGLELPVTVEDHLRKRHGSWQAEVVPGAAPNARTHIELEEELPGGLGRYRLAPETGRTHQLRMHLLGLGAPIVGDPLYPEIREVDVDDFRTPLQLLASGLAFDDPVDGGPRRFASRRALPLAGAAD
ncbi:pseudouridine synthase [Leucobacter allii]|uniref:RNA pseudouridylate synthase n=1 Tax=Leucobacter allii TaxID=2932247 RepID=A0ABY4FQ45_9MICO|nr:pseudouridine synthase [Leucobacter allii]UOQ58396.1 pseudouridine synthase [Leucobacter allii]